jgi:hypothetical protein
LSTPPALMLVGSRAAPKAHAHGAEPDGRDFEVAVFQAFASAFASVRKLDHTRELRSRLGPEPVVLLVQLCQGLFEDVSRLGAEHQEPVVEDEGGDTSDSE